MKEKTLLSDILDIDIIDIFSCHNPHKLKNFILNKTIPVGMRSVIWNAQDQPSGMYFIRMQSGDFIGTQKVMLLK